MTQNQKLTDYFGTIFKDNIKTMLLNTGKYSDIEKHIDLLAENTLLELLQLLDENTSKQLLERATRLEADGLETFKLTVTDYLNGELTSLRDSAKDSLQEVAHGNGIG